MQSQLRDEIAATIADASPDRIFILTDSNVAEIEKSLIDSIKAESTIIIPAGEESKSIATLTSILSQLSASGATRRSLLICIGGGMTTDIGGFAAAIFKRGIRHMNVATTLLGAVDAAVGGKTGIDFAGLKNEIGAFHMPLTTLADTLSFASLPDAELLSGFGEVIKTAMISDADMTAHLLNLDPLSINPEEMSRICRFCRDCKNRVVDKDPTEKGLRKILNFGHTAGHALESLMLERRHPVAHGTAVALGILVSLILSNIQLHLPSAHVSAYARWLRAHYPQLPFTCADYADIWRLTLHDKKNAGKDTLNFVLLSDIGAPLYDRPVSRPLLEEALDIYQELQGR